MRAYMHIAGLGLGLADCRYSNHIMISIIPSWMDGWMTAATNELI